jgi:hypothetical protein
VSLFGGGRTRSVRYSASGEWFNIDGYIPVSTEQDPGIAPRGPVDSLLGSTHLSGYASAGYQAANGWRADVGANVFDEDRTNGTPQSINSTAWRQGSGEWLAVGWPLGARGFGGTQRTADVRRSVLRRKRSYAIQSLDVRPRRPVVSPGGALLLVGREGATSARRSRAVRTRPAAAMSRSAARSLGSAFVQGTWRPSDGADDRSAHT